MGKNRAVLSIIALLLGAGGLGFGLINWIDQGKTDFWYDYKSGLYAPPFIEYVTIPDLYVIVVLEAPATLQLLFTTSAEILPDPVSFADMIFYFFIDGTRLLEPYTRAGPYQGTGTYLFIPVTLQFVLELPAGSHNISISVYSETVGNTVRHSVLSVTRVNT